MTRSLEAGEVHVAAELLRRGDLVAFPTETVYGLGADARNGEAVARIFEAKNRPRFNPLIVHVKDLEAAEELADFPDAAAELADAFWPGPLTLVLPSKGQIADIVSAGQPSVALRVPSHGLAKALLAAAGLPIAAPSANPSGKVSPTTAAHVLDGLMGKIAAVLDGGPSGIGLESTIIGFEENQPVLMRAGAIPSEDIKHLTGSLKTHAGHVVAPGQLLSHYAPDATLRLNAEVPEAGETWLGFGPGPEGANLSPGADLREAAANLFKMLRELDEPGKSIAVAKIPTSGLGEAINDRLIRAAAKRT
jgi:L-threonylcarbamoyladenylate synthase